MAAVQGSGPGKDAPGANQPVPVWLAALMVVFSLVAVAVLAWTVSWATAGGVDAATSAPGSEEPAFGGGALAASGAPTQSATATQQPTTEPPSPAVAPASPSRTAAAPPPASVSILSPWSASLLATRAAHWDQVAAALPAGVVRAVTVRGPSGGGQDGLQAFADDLAARNDARVLASCLTRPESYISRSYLDDKLRAAVLAALATPPMDNPAGWVWTGEHLTLFVSSEDFASAYTCPDVHLTDEFENVRPEDLQWLAYRYLQRSAGTSPTEDSGRDIGCSNRSGNLGWGPLAAAGSTKDPIPYQSLGDPFGGAVPALSGPPPLSTGARDAGDGFTYYVASGFVPFADGTSRQITFVMGSLWLPPNPCLGDVFEGEPAKVATR